VISVVIPAFRGLSFIGRALAAVRDQTEPDWELIVAEDGTGDGTEAVVEEFAKTVPQPVRYRSLGVRLGTSAARNAALDLSRGELVAFLDADDQWRPSHLASLAECAAAGHAVAVSVVEIWDAMACRTVAIHGMDPAWLARPRDALFVQSIIHTASCVALPRATLDRVGLFDTALPIGQDRDYWFRSLADGGSLGYSAACTARHVRHEANSTRDRRAVFASSIAFYEKHRHAAGISSEARRHAAAQVLAARAALAASGAPACT
jgi:glycosyltransferase involved in cell wall biosynthesis